MMDVTTIAMICLAAYLILIALQQLLKLNFEAMPFVLGALAGVAGVLILIGLL